MNSYEEESPTAMLDHVAFVPEPNIRFGHTAIVHKSLMYVFGGWDGTETLDTSMHMTWRKTFGLNLLE